MGGSAKAVQKTTASETGQTTSQLPQQQQANVDLLMKGARDFYNSGGPSYFPGQTYAGPTAGELLARQQATQYAGGAGQNFVNNVQSGENFWLNPANIFNPENIPGFRESQGYVTDSITRNLTESILPELRSGSTAQGVLGGSRQEIGEGLATEGTSRAIGEALAGMEMGAYGQGLNMYNSAASRAPQTFGLGLAPADVNKQVGLEERADTQLGIDDAMARFNFEEMAPLMNLEALKELTGFMGQYGGDIFSSGTSSSKTTKKTSGGAMESITQAVGMAIMAYAMMGSHSSLKKDIVPATNILEKLQSLSIFRWKYKEEEVAHIGPMAEDFQRIFEVGDGKTLHAFDLLGVLLGAVKELSLKGEQ